MAGEKLPKTGGFFQQPSEWVKLTIYLKSCIAEREEREAADAQEKAAKERRDQERRIAQIEQAVAQQRAQASR